jgi:hypothetical protein
MNFFDTTTCIWPRRLSAIPNNSESLIPILLAACRIRRCFKIRRDSIALRAWQFVFVSVDHGTPMRLPPDLRDWVPADHIVHSVMDAVKLLDLTSACRSRKLNGLMRPRPPQIDHRTFVQTPIQNCRLPSADHHVIVRPMLDHFLTLGIICHEILQHSTMIFQLGQKIVIGHLNGTA